MRRTLCRDGRKRKGQTKHIGALTSAAKGQTRSLSRAISAYLGEAGNTCPSSRTTLEFARTANVAQEGARDDHIRACQIDITWTTAAREVAVNRRNRDFVRLERHARTGLDACATARIDQLDARAFK